MIGIDTFSWGKIIKLRNKREWTQIMEEIIENVNWFITMEGKKEFLHFFPKDEDVLEKGAILPILNIHMTDFTHQGFDPCDASLLEYNKEKKYRIVTEDRPMLLEGVTTEKNIISLIDLFWELSVNFNYFESREFYHLIKLFRKWKNIDQTKAKLIEKNRKQFL